MKCPHAKCGFETPAHKAEWNEKTAPKVGNFSLCLECGGFSIITGRDSLRPATLQEYNSIKNAPEMLLLGRLREYGYKLHLDAQTTKTKAKAK